MEHTKYKDTNKLKVKEIKGWKGESVSTCKILLAENSGGRSKKFF